MTSTGRSIEPCSSWTARWRETRCYDTKRSRRGNRGAGKGGRDRRWTQHCRTRDPTRRRQGWMLMRFTTRFSAPSAPLRWPCSIKTRSTTSSTSWPATAEMEKKTLFYFPGLSQILHLPGVFKCKKKKDRADSFVSILLEGRTQLWSLWVNQSKSITQLVISLAWWGELLLDDSETSQYDI